MKKYEIDDFANKFLSRMTPKGTTLSSEVASVQFDQNVDRELGDAIPYLRYLGNEIHFGYVENTGLWVRIDLSENNLHKNKFKENLEKKLITSPPNSGKVITKKYSRIISSRKLDSDKKKIESVKVKYKTKSKNSDEIFEALWFNLKPAIKSLYESN